MPTDCDKCEDLRQEVTIRGRKALVQAHRVVMANIADGTIVEAYVPTFHKAKYFAALFGVGLHHFNDVPREDFASLMQLESTQDVGAHYFRCTSCQLMFEFSLHPYQPSGRVWGPILDQSMLNQP